MLRGEYQRSLQPTAWPMLSKQRPGNVSWLIQTCCQPRLTLWVLSGAGKGNVTEGMRDDRHPGTGTAGWQVCVCIYVCVSVLAGGEQVEIDGCTAPKWQVGRSLRHGPKDSQRELFIHDVADSQTKMLPWRRDALKYFYCAALIGWQTMATFITQINR